MEGQNAIKHNLKVDLSEQELVDCSAAYLNFGCKGGLMDRAFLYIQEYGISSLSDYPYTAVQKDCAKTPKNRSNLKLTGYKDVSSESNLQAAVGEHFSVLFSST